MAAVGGVLPIVQLMQIHLFLFSDSAGSRGAIEILDAYNYDLLLYLFDEQFLMMLKDECSITDKEGEERQMTRQLETETVSEAPAILSRDDARDVFA